LNLAKDISGDIWTRSGGEMIGGGKLQ